MGNKYKPQQGGPQIVSSLREWCLDGGRLTSGLPEHVREKISTSLSTVDRKLFLRSGNGVLTAAD
jgi:hypothetical protein